MNCRLSLIGATAGLLTTIAFGLMPAAASPCTNLSFLRLKDTTITSATDWPKGTFPIPNSNPQTTVPTAFCRVTATLTPTSDSTVHIEVWLPEAWNGRFLGTGGGGFGGVFNYVELSGGVGSGFATVNSDLGTFSSGCNPNYCGTAGNMGNQLAEESGAPANPTTGLYGHPERIKDFGYRAIHLMTLRGKEIAKAFYQKKAQTAYFFGCSEGGRNGLMEAQRFPEDYNGIIAGDAAFNRTHLHMGGVDLWQVTHATPGNFILPGQMTLINKAVLAQCVGQDGGVTTDQFLTDPRDCRFDPKALQCTSANLPPTCLTPGQVATMRNYYAGLFDPVTGELIYPGYERGNETDDISQGGLAYQERLPEPFYDGVFYWVFGSNFGIPSSPINYTNFDFHNDVDKVDDVLAEPLNAVSTDLSKFRERGGKLIMYHGWADTVIPSQSSINYFNALVRHDSHDEDGIEQVRFEPNGDYKLRKTQEYARLFMVPGMYHCSGGPGPNLPEVDTLMALVNWVETGVAPEIIIATNGVMSRPLCVFPKVAKYKGSGNSNDAINFICVTDEPDFNQTPTPQYGP
ncbi:MAG TPA: tannase/feruloyl esterase family alpha/beta hydrolase [Methylocella sp.]|nr:tannase/feruloyl esterase family alpha/beta hydrolase [Methylocella sp.]